MDFYWSLASGAPDMIPAPASARFPAATIVAVAALFVGLALAGCLSPGTGPAGEPEPLVFSESRGPGDVDALISLSGDPQEDAQAILDECAKEPDREDCVVEHLKSVLGASGSVYAFDVLEAMSELDSMIERRNHPMAHLLGHHAVYVYGTIGNTLMNCSHKVFQGCIHGALEEYFRHVEELDAQAVRQVCPMDGTSFERYACLHGLGHGLVLATDYDLQRALDLCASLQTAHSRSSCYGGAFMENVVAFLDHQRILAEEGDDGAGDHHDHHDHHGHHGHGGPPEFWVDEDDLQVPCNVVDEKYEVDCWGMQTSLVLHFNEGDFEATARLCDELSPGPQERCYRSLGRDISSRTMRDPGLGSRNCGYASDDALRALCVRGWIATVVTRFADPAAGLSFCEGFDEVDKPACYEGIGTTGRGMVDADALAEVCHGAEESYRDDCRRGGKLT